MCWYYQTWVTGSSLLAYVTLLSFVVNTFFVKIYSPLTAMVIQLYLFVNMWDTIGFSLVEVDVRCISVCQSIGDAKQLVNEKKSVVW